MRPHGACHAPALSPRPSPASGRGEQTVWNSSLVSNQRGFAPRPVPLYYVWISRFCREIAIKMPIPAPSVTSAVPP